MIGPEDCLIWKGIHVPTISDLVLSSHVVNFMCMSIIFLYLNEIIVKGQTQDEVKFILFHAYFLLSI